MARLMFLLLFVVLYSCNYPAQSQSSSNRQSLGKDRVDRLRKSVVRILIDNKPAGTGFVIVDSNNKVIILTCWHVIKPALVQLDISHQKIGKDLSVEFIDGEKIKADVGFQAPISDRDINNAVAYDYCILSLSHKPNQEITNFKLGRFSDVDDGDAVYTCGYPLGIEQQFISMGIVSTKYIDSSQTIDFHDGNKPTVLYRSVALLDLTMNKGNSGGPIIKLGQTAKDDRVIGIADFIITAGGDVIAPNLDLIDKTEPLVLKTKDTGIGFNVLGAIKVLTSIAVDNTNGISGCISIDHFKKLIAVY